MKRDRKGIQLLVVVGGAAVLIGGVAVWLGRPTAEELAVERYSEAGCLAPNRQGFRRGWNQAVPLADGKSVRVLATGEMNTMFELAFSDEDWRRQVTTWWDYSYPS